MATLIVSLTDPLTVVGQSHLIPLVRAQQLLKNCLLNAVSMMSGVLFTPHLPFILGSARMVLFLLELILLVVPFLGLIVCVLVISFLVRIRIIRRLFLIVIYQLPCLVALGAGN